MKPIPGLPDTLGYLFRRKIDFYPQLFQNIRGSAFTAGCPVTVFGDPDTGSCRDYRGGSGDIKGVQSVSPVPTISDAGPSVVTLKALARITSAIPAISSPVSPFIVRAVRKEPSWAGVAWPSIISVMTAAASSFEEVLFFSQLGDGFFDHFFKLPSRKFLSSSLPD